ncbi:hypothetical protein FB451DRAFT_1148499 [Mycena latifolia]|nr:hypothetical protein FB451DRAFT_1148499 [Mycena latifolia]
MSNEDAFTPVDDLWFSNDTLILRAEGKGFRVSKSILAARSPVFQSMLEFPQPVSDGDQMLDESPVVRLHDSAEDVEPFLRAIFDSSYFMPPPAEIDFHAVLGILRLSHKYDVEYLHKRALRHLETVYPVEATEYQAIPSNKLHYKDGIIALDLKAIPILQELGATWLLPYAFYSVGTYTHSDMVYAGEWWDQLPLDTKQTCFAVHAHLAQAVTRIAGFLANPSTCMGASVCNPVKLDFLRSRVIQRRSGAEHPFMEWHEHDWDFLGEVMCTTCVYRARAEHQIIEAEIWDELPAYCGLESWDVLKEKRRAALE